MRLKHEFTGAFDCVKAEDTLKDSTLVFLQNEIGVRSKRTKRTVPLRLAYAFTMIFMIFGMSFGANAIYFTEVSYITIDVNPSVELALNRLDRVVSVTAYNSEGADIISSLPLKNKPYSDAVQTLIDDEALSGFFTENAVVSLTVQTNSKEKEALLMDSLRQCTNQISSQVECHFVSPQLREQARSNKMSSGKFRAVQELQTLDPTVTPDQCRNLSMDELEDRIGACHQDGHGNGNGKGNGQKHHHPS